ncbi:molybdopterin converting factor subunit 1 [Mucilaginibacter aquatilis]|uniref:Molybdopterin converting factor subunit 1 n=1 Tax=Mucilaginibacter aquatilis TaxID=1517760 RepID=A0A6I4IQU3_9SPHI|nr:molybdopterin converting factor subunit 1 [Mucilaginibacter aquatilis]MVN92303.1 molybdopterin converting factor subunit 1 [Mucilaginibacter aquatilis]
MNVLLFGITRDITGQSRLTVPADAGVTTVAGLKQWLGMHYPAFKQLQSLAIAVDNDYASDEDTIGPEQEIALIPPVSGG